MNVLHLLHIDEEDEEDLRSRHRRLRAAYRNEQRHITVKRRIEKAINQEDF